MQHLAKGRISRLAIITTSAGSMVGCGWLFSALYAAQIAGPAALISWILALVCMLCIALPMCELGAMFPLSGGLSNYTRMTHGPFIGFIFAWVMWLSYVVMTPIEVQAMLQYGSVFFPQLSYKDPITGIENLTGFGYVIALLLLVVLMAINTLNVKFLANSNKWLTVWKFFVPVLAIVSFFCMAKTYRTHELIDLHLGSISTWHNICSALAMGGVAFAFTGFQNGLLLAGEVENPQRNIPFSILGAVIIGFILYFGLQLAFLWALPIDATAQGYAHLSFAGDAGPLVGLALLLGLKMVSQLIVIDAVTSPMATALVYTTVTARLIFSMAKNGFLPKRFLTLNKQAAPTFALVINCLLGALAFVPFKGWVSLVNFLSSISVMAYGIGPICVLALRYQVPHTRRPFVLPIKTWICTIAFCVCNFMLYWCGWTVIWKLYLLIMLAVVLYVYVQRQSVHMSHSFWFFFYLHAMVLVSYLGSFGGGLNQLSSPLDLIVIVGISCVSLWWSVQARLTVALVPTEDF